MLRPLCFLVLLTPCLVASAGLAQNYRILEQSLDSNRHGYSVVRLWGSHYEMGFAMGSLFAEDIASAVEEGRDYLGFLYEVAREAISGTDWLTPELENEIAGITAGVLSVLPGCGVDSLDVKVFNTVGDWGYAGFCRSHSCWGDFTQSPVNTLSTRRLEYETPYDIDRHHVLAAWDPDDGSPRWVNLAWVGYVSAVTAVNEYGTLVSLHDYGSSFDSAGNPVARCLAARHVLTMMGQRPVEEHLDWAAGELSAMTIATGTFLNYLVPDGLGGVFTCHTGGHCDPPRRPKQDYFSGEVLICTNSQTTGSQTPGGGGFIADYYQEGGPKNIQDHFELLATHGLHVMSVAYRSRGNMTIWALGLGRSDVVQMEWTDLFDDVVPDDGGQPDGGPDGGPDAHDAGPDTQDAGDGADDYDGGWPDGGPGDPGADEWVLPDTRDGGQADPGDDDVSPQPGDAEEPAIIGGCACGTGPGALPSGGSLLLIWMFLLAFLSDRIRKQRGSTSQTSPGVPLFFQYGRPPVMMLPGGRRLIMRLCRLLSLALLATAVACGGNSGNGDPVGGDAGTADGADGGSGDRPAGDDANGADAPDAGDGGDAGDPWAGCPAAPDYQGGDWSSEMLLEVTPEATYCFTFDSTIPVEEQVPLQSMVRMAPGEYGLPAEAGEFSMILPACVLLGEAGERLQPAGNGTAIQEIQNGYFSLDICQPFLDGAGDSWFLHLFWGNSLPAPGEKLTLGARSLFRSDAWMALVKDGCGQPRPLRYQSCHYDWVAPRRQRVRFEGGEVTLTLHLPQIDATVFGLFSRAAGELDGSAFDQFSYWKLAFHSMLHFFFCDFIVLFDRPIGPACGIKIDELLIWGGTDNPERKLELIDCSLNPLGERTILSAEEFP